MSKMCPECKQELPITGFGRCKRSRNGRRPQCLVCSRKLNQAQHWILRLEVLRYYSGEDDPLCAICGNHNIATLAVDHINGGGNKHYKERRRRDLAEWLGRKGFPSGFRVLCHNCNSVLGFYGMNAEESQRKIIESIDWYLSPDRSANTQTPQYVQAVKWWRRLEVLKHYSDGLPKCEYCGQGNVALLAVDHINGGGKQHQVPGRNLANWLFRQDFPNGYRILCHNCNLCLGVYGEFPEKAEIKIRDSISWYINRPNRKPEESIWTEDAIASVKERYGNGEKLQDIASELGVGRETIWAHVGRLREWKLSEDQITEINERYAVGESQQDLAVEFNVSPRTLRRRCKAGLIRKIPWDNEREIALRLIFGEPLRTISKQTRRSVDVIERIRKELYHYQFVQTKFDLN